MWLGRSAVLFTNATFIGIDPTASERPIVYAAIDHECQLLALGEGALDDVLAFAAGQKQAIVAICSPRSPNIGLMKNKEIREKLSPQPAPGRWINYRLADYFLRKRNIFTPPVYGEEKLCPKWMRQGFLLFKRLLASGYQLFPDQDEGRFCLEIYPHASFTALLGVLPFPKTSLEGRLQRQLVLYEKGLQLPDPMGVFEEITRHKLLKGILPLERIFTPRELDALVGAYTASRVITQPDGISSVGDMEEGQVILPVLNLKSYYL